jgi:HSP20 family protein
LGRRIEAMSPQRVGTSIRRFVGDLLGDIDRAFDGAWMGSSHVASPRYGESAVTRRRWTPRLDVVERAGQLLVHVDLPGMRLDDIRAYVEDGILVISGERMHQHEHERDGVYTCERTYGRFERRVALPEGVAPEAIQASFDNGVLEITMPMPKQAAAKGRLVPIQSKSHGMTH